MFKTEAIRREPDTGDVAEPATLALKVAAARAAATRAALSGMRERALDLSREARGRARSEITKRRTAAATTLENLAATLRPQDKARARRRTAAIAGGSTLALAAALGAGVAIGMYIARRLKAKKEPVVTDVEGAAEPQVSGYPAGATSATPPPPG